jgi:hypothetical protein
VSLFNINSTYFEIVYFLSSKNDQVAGYKLWKASQGNGKGKISVTQAFLQAQH